MASYDMMRAYLDLVVAGDYAGSMDYFSDDVTLHMSGWGTAHGKDEYQSMLGQVMDAFGSLDVEEHDLLVSDDHAVVLNSWHIDPNGRDIRVNNAIIYHTSGDKITDIWIVPEDQKLISDLLG